MLHTPAKTETTRFDDPHLDSLLPAVAFNRRGFLVSGGAVGFAAVGYALAAGPVNAQSVIQTPADGLEVADVKIPVTGGTMPGYVAAPAKAGKYPVVIVVPEIFGMHEYQKDICRRLAKLGYLAITQDPFFRIGDLSKISEIREVLANANKLDDTQMLSDLDALVAFVETQPKANVKKLAITGMCRGGRTVWMYTAHSPKIKAAVSWYGGMNPMAPSMPQTPHDVAGKLNAPVLGLYAGADAGIPTALVSKMQEALKTGNRNSKASEFILYPGVPHAFHADYRPSYRKEAAQDGWQKMLAWFKTNGVA